MIKEDILEKELVQHRHWIGHIAEAVVKLCTENGIKPDQMEGIFNACRYGTHEPVIDDRPHEDFIMDFEDLEDQLETCRSEFQEALDLLVRARRVISGEFPGRDITISSIASCLVTLTARITHRHPKRTVRIARLSNSLS